MLQIHLHPRWQFSDDASPPLDASRLLALLAAIAHSGSIAQAARDNDLSYRHAWGLVQQAERLLANLCWNAAGAGVRASPKRASGWCGRTRASPRGCSR
jgi:molybdenum-dependent DNA-binding transcriptional regulator ModE